MSRAAVNVEGLDDPLRLFGEHDRNLTALERALEISVRSSQGELVLDGSSTGVQLGEHALRSLLGAAQSGAHVTPDDVSVAIDAARADGTQSVAMRTLLQTSRGREVRPRTSGQRTLVEQMEKSTLTFAVGPAGSGKTFLAVVAAVRALKEKQVARLILSRPAVEAGEKLGFLPGDIREKVDPYLRPLYDALALLLEDGTVQKYMERGIIEVAPLAYLRGRTLSDAFVILDEAQNTTREQMKMFLTRLGESSRMVVAGDVTQIDLPRGVRSGLVDAVDRFGDVEDVSIVRLTESDIVRHPLVARIVRAYER